MTLILHDMYGITGYPVVRPRRPEGVLLPSPAVIEDTFLFLIGFRYVSAVGFIPSKVCICIMSLGTSLSNHTSIYAALDASAP